MSPVPQVPFEEQTMAAVRTVPEVARSDDWRWHASCRSVDPDLFFPVGVTGLALDQIDAAKAVCGTCPVSDRCLEFALATNQESGVWGGRSEEERRALRRQRRLEARRATA
jgi:WhiB family transcriptional regulator, redox-sensing transcriptional regulator